MFPFISSPQINSHHKWKAQELNDIAISSPYLIEERYCSFLHKLNSQRKCQGQKWNDPTEGLTGLLTEKVR